MTLEGLLRAKLVGNANMYDPNEVHQLKKIREEGMSIPEIAARAARAEMTAYRLERQVTQLLSVIGADIPSADLAPEAVVALHLKIEDAAKSADFADVGDIMFWARTFQSLSEQYFHVVSKQFETEEPWRPYLELSNKLLKGAPFAALKTDVELAIAYNYLELARRNLRQVMFFYVRATSNKRIAHRLFPESVGDFHEDVMSMVSVIVDQ